MSRRRADKIREELEHLIVTHELQDGERLDEVKLAERFSVSRTPLREALQTLAASGLVELIPRRGAFVRHPNFAEMLEMFEVMAELEAMSGRLASRRATDEMLAELDKSIDECETARAAGDVDAYFDANTRFHFRIFDACGNSFLRHEALKLYKRLQPFRRMQLRVRGRMPQSHNEHRQILDAMKAADEDRTASLLRSHVAIQGEKFNFLMSCYKTDRLG